MNKEGCKVGKLKQTSLNQKEILIRLVNVDGETIRKASYVIGINKSTARNITLKSLFKPMAYLRKKFFFSSVEA